MFITAIIMERPLFCVVFLIQTMLVLGMVHKGVILQSVHNYDYHIPKG